MEYKKLRLKAKGHLHNAGYGSGTNYSTETVIGLMTEFAQEQIKNSNIDVNNHTCATCLYCQINPSSEFMHDRHKCTLDEPIVNIVDATKHTCNDWAEIPF